MISFNQGAISAVVRLNDEGISVLTIHEKGRKVVDQEFDSYTEARAAMTAWWEDYLVRKKRADEYAAVFLWAMLLLAGTLTGVEFSKAMGWL